MLMSKPLSQLARWARVWLASSLFAFCFSPALVTLGQSQGGPVALAVQRRESQTAAQQEKGKNTLEKLRVQVRLKPNVATLHNDLGVALAQAGELDDAIEEFKKAVSLKRDFTEAQNNLGVAYANQAKRVGRSDEASYRS